MANPFLMMDDEVEDAANEAVSNPFLIEETQNDEEFTDNPFVTQGTNPFAAFGEEDDTVAVTVPEAAAPSNDAAMSFFGTTINEADEDAPAAFGSNKLQNPLANLDGGVSEYSSEDELAKKKVPPRPLPPSQTTQDLIFAVADQLDQASSQMLGRLPKTRTPSPVSMRDFHSPSPTPDSALADFLDYSEDNTQQNNIFEQDLMGGGNDNPFAPTSVPVMQAVAPAQPIVKPQPPRPPPPRPIPPRPTPPAIPTTSHTHAAQPAPAQIQQNQEPDLFDMFGDSSVPPPKPQGPKTTQDILSLFAAPKPAQQQQPAQFDFLSGDILDDIPSDNSALPPPFSESASQPIIHPAAPVPAETFPIVEMQPTISEPQPPVIEQAEESPVQLVEESQKPVMDSIIPEVYKRAPTPDIEITTVESLPRSDDEEEPQPEIEKDPEPDPEPEVEAELEKSEIEPVMDESDQSLATESNVTTQGIPGSPMEVNPTEHISDQEQMDTGLDFAPSIPSGSASANPFASPETEDIYPNIQQHPASNIFAVEEPVVVQQPATNIFASEEPMQHHPATNIFAVEEPVMQSSAFVDSFAPAGTMMQPVTPIPSIFSMEDPSSGGGSDTFDAFSAKFDCAKKDDVSLLDGFGGTTPVSGGDAWGDGDDFGVPNASGDGFGGEEGFDSFLAMKAPERPVLSRKDSNDSLNENEKEFNVVIRPKGDMAQGIAPVLAPPPPPRGGSQNNSIYSGDSSPRFNPFDKGDEVASADGIPSIPEPAALTRTDSQETPQTPLFDDDVSQPLEDFPRITYTGQGWEMQLRQPNKKKITGQRFWKKVFVKLVYQGDNPVVQLYNQATDKEPFQELPLQPCYSVSDIGAQQYDQFGKIFTVKLQYIFYKERPGVRPGQVTKAERLTNKLSQFAAYAIQGDYQGVKEFGSDLKKLGLPVEHAPQVSQLFKIGSMSFEDMKQFSVTIEEALFKLAAHRDRALNYKSEEVQITAVDELYAEQDSEGHVSKQIARVRLFFLGFLSGMPSIELGVNDLWRQGKEVVGRHDIIPVVTEEWIRLEGVEFHNTVQQDEYERSRTIKFQPPDACYIELMRFRVRPPKNRELPLQLKATWCVTGNKVELRADVLVPGFASRKLGQIPCEDVSIRFPIPECWIYLFRVEKHFRYGSVKSAHRRTGKIKGIERILGAVDTLQESLIEVTSGQAKYEHHHKAIVWRCPRLPKEGQGAYTTHQMVCRMALTSYDQIPEQLAPYCYVEFTMPATQVSHTTVRSVSVQESDSDEPPEKYVRYLARHEYRVGIESTQGETQNAYLSATRTTIKEEAPQQQPASSPMAPSDSDSESN